MNKKTINIYFDEECPFCRYYANYVKLKDNYDLHLFNARESLEKIKLFREKGFDINLVKNLSDLFSIPVIASGGMGNIDHLSDLIDQTNIDAVCMADILHYKKSTIPKIKSEMVQKGFSVRKYYD